MAPRNSPRRIHQERPAQQVVAADASLRRVGDSGALAGNFHLVGRLARAAELRRWVAFTLCIC
jgi:hypothetical protein